MRKVLIILSVLAFSYTVKAQLGVSIHQSNLPFVGINYEIEERFLPEARIGTDSFFEDLSFEFTISYLILKRDKFDFYSGLGGRTNDFAGFVLPVGVNFYPFEEKVFGFHIETAGIFSDDGNILRGSWGIRYNFRR